MEWRLHTTEKAFEDSLVFKGGSDIKEFSNKTHVISNLNALIVGSDQESFFSCKTFFDTWKTGSGKLHAASNAPEYIYIWNSTVFWTKRSTLKPTAKDIQSLISANITSHPKTDVDTQASKEESGNECKQNILCLQIQNIKLIAMHTIYIYWH